MPASWTQPSKSSALILLGVLSAGWSRSEESHRSGFVRHALRGEVELIGRQPFGLQAVGPIVLLDQGPAALDICEQSAGM